MEVWPSTGVVYDVSAAHQLVDPGAWLVKRWVATLAQPLPWHEGLIRIRRHLEGVGKKRQSLCGVELRCPEPHSMAGFIAFNQKYCALLEDWDMIVDDCNPLARTNVAPVDEAPEETLSLIHISEAHETDSYLV